MIGTKCDSEFVVDGDKRLVATLEGVTCNRERCYKVRMRRAGCS